MPLHHAAHDGSEAIVRLLLGKGADVNARGFAGITALDRVFYRKDKMMALLLLDSRAEDQLGWAVSFLKDADMNSLPNP